jgi:hypothetical protein
VTQPESMADNICEEEEEKRSFMPNDILEF